MMDDTLTILTLETTKMVSKLNRKSLRALEKSGPPQCARVRKSQESFAVLVSVSPVNREGQEKRKMHYVNHQRSEC